MPIPINILESLSSGEIDEEGIATNEQKLLGTNCEKIELLTFQEEGNTYHVIVKRSRVEAQLFSKIVSEYQIMKEFLGDIIPNQAFFIEKRKEIFDREMLTAICTPVIIAYDIFQGENNWNVFLEEYRKNTQLQKDIEQFISGYKKLKDKGVILDLYGKENLVITRDGRLKYIDSFRINISDTGSLKEESEKKFQKISTLIG
ncbi:hypothetical protein KBB25_03075 [Candidatus Gracilibacteria bacterium]|nr:hypothetical protein [Candidatus Gracilibacteria bacterium]